MKKIIAAFLLISTSCFGQAIASRRYALQSPTNIAFGPFSSVAPYNEANGYTAIPFGQAMPSSTLIGSNNFASTSNFTQYGTGPTFDVSGNVGSFTWAGGSQSSAVWTDNTGGYTLTIPNLFESVYVTQDTTGSNFSVIGLGVAIDSTHYVFSNWCTSCNPGGGVNTSVHVDTGSGDQQACRSGISIVIPPPPYYLAVSITSNTMIEYYSTDGANWTNLGGCSFSSYLDLTATSSINSYKPAISVSLNSAGTYKISAWQWGLAGGVGVANPHIFMYQDGRPYSRGSVIYFDAFTPDPDAAGSSTIFAYDTATGSLASVGSLWVNNGGTLVPVISGSILYDPQHDIERVVTQIDISHPYLLYASQSISTDDWLSPGPHISPLATHITDTEGSGQIYDPSISCIQWNQSAGTCSLWVVSAAVGSAGDHVAHAQSSTSDPSLDSFSTIFTDSVASYEGAVINRTATTYAGHGVAYETCVGGIISSTTRDSRCYNMAGTFVGSINATWPPAIAPYNPSHPQMFCLGNKAYLIGMNDNGFVTHGQVIGNFIVATSTSGCGS